MALEVVAKSRTAAHREVVRARVLAAAADGVANSANAASHGVTAVSVRSWRRDVEVDGLANWGKVRPGRGRKPSISDETVAKIVDLTSNSRPRGHTHWSCRTGLQPDRVDSFEFGNDLHLTDKLIDVVGLYLNPPEHAVVPRMDEKSQIQALDRTQASLPTAKGRAATMTHDDKRNGTTTLFAALDVLSGTVIAQCLPRHRREEFLVSLGTIDRQVPRNLQVHLILDNHGTHKHPEVKRWLARHKRFHLHVTLTSSSWLNQVERWFRELTDKNLHRGIFSSVPDLIASIESDLTAHNNDPKPDVWTATAESILAKVQRARTSPDRVVSSS